MANVNPSVGGGSVALRMGKTGGGAAISSIIKPDILGFGAWSFLYRCDCNTASSGFYVTYQETHYENEYWPTTALKKRTAYGGSAIIQVSSGLGYSVFSQSIATPRVVFDDPIWFSNNVAFNHKFAANSALMASNSYVYSICGYQKDEIIFVDHEGFDYTQWYTIIGGSQGSHIDGYSLSTFGSGAVDSVEAYENRSN